MRTIIFISALLLHFNLFSQDPVVVVAYGSGETKDLAVNNALRACIEKTIGGFISTNTTVVNDEILSDEMLAISQGNIESYEIMSEKYVAEEGYYTITVSAFIAPQTIVSYLNSQGITASYKGNVAFQNLLAERYYEEQESKIIQDYIRTWSDVVFFDYKIGDIEQPFAINQISLVKNIKYGAAYPVMYNSSSFGLNQINPGGRNILSGVIKENNSYLNKYSFYERGKLVGSDWDKLFDIYYNGYSQNKVFSTYSKAYEYQFAIGLTILSKPNENFYEFHRGLINILNKITLNPNTIEYRENSGLPVYPIYKENFQPIYLRNWTTFEILIALSEKIAKGVFDYDLRTGGNSIDYLQKFSFGKVWTPYGNAHRIDFDEPGKIRSGRGTNSDCGWQWWNAGLNSRHGNKFVLGDIFMMIKALPLRGMSSSRDHEPVYYIPPIEPKNGVLYSCYNPVYPNPGDYYSECRFCEYKVMDGTYYYSRHRVWHLISTMDEISQISEYTISPKASL